jgi:zinc/manganese transport system substrate-binding protein
VLQDRAGNPRARDVFFAADHVELIDPQPGAIGTPWAGDVHAQGNPHLHLDPRRLLQVSRALGERLAKELPAERMAIEQRSRAFEAAWRQHLADWERRASPLRGRRIAAQHTTFGYLWHWLGVQPLADLEPKPGMSPTPGHLQRLLEGLRASPPAAVVIASYQDPRPGRWLTGQLSTSAAGIRVPLLTLPATVPETAGEKELVLWMEGLVRELLQGLR